MPSMDSNDILTRVGPGTPMGELMREYWIPACLSQELAPDAPPMRLKLLGEKLIAFRDTYGPCRHPGSSLPAPLRLHVLRPQRRRRHPLRLSRLEVRRRRQLPRHAQHPEDQRFTERVKAKAYKIAERGGLVWVYMGKREVPPPLPALEVFGLPADERIVMCHQRDCNWLQSLEGDIDTSHFGFLHVGAVKPTTSIPRPCTAGAWSTARRATMSRRPTGARCTRPIARPIRATYFHRFAHFMFPCFALVPDGTFSNMIQATLSVPLDDSHTMTYDLAWTKREQALRTLKDGSTIPGAALTRDFLPTTTDWLGRWRLKATATTTT